jgi:DNA repair exonuclease SbcCD ATPase subunit
MAKIDVTGIEGYADMTAEEKLAALEAYEYDDHSAEIADLDKYKDAVTKANHEAAELKKQVKTLQDQQKTGNSKADDTIAKLQKQVEELTRQNTIASYAAQFTALGYDAELAQATAIATADGDVATVFENQRKFLEQHDKDVKAEIFKQTPKPGQGGTGKQAPAMTLEKFKKLSQIERMNFANDFPEEYAKLYGGN